MTNQYSIYRSVEGKQEFLKAYVQSLHKLWDGIRYETVFVETSFGRTHVIVSGPKDAPPLVLLHGMTFNSIMWYSNVPSLNQYRVYCIDTPGDYGKSEVVTPIKTKSDCTAWLTDVLDHFNLGKIVLIGHSMGGWLSLHFSLAQPDRVEKLVLLAPVSSIIRLPLKFAVKVYPVIARPSREKVLKLWDWFVAEGNKLNDDIMEIIVQGWLHCRPQLRVFPRVFRNKELRQLSPKTLFLVGLRKLFFPPIKQSHASKS